MTDVNRADYVGDERRSFPASTTKCISALANTLRESPSCIILVAVILEQADMGSPKEHLPHFLTEVHVRSLLDTLSSPPPQAIRKLKVTAEFHVISVVSYTASDFKLWLASREVYQSWPVSTTELILRISGNHISRIKTENEASVLSWLDKNTMIPVPRVVAYDSSTDNPLGHEFILMTREPGESLAKMYSSFTSAQMDYVLDQLIDA